jgi:hypothetical protein
MKKEIYSLISGIIKLLLLFIATTNAGKLVISQTFIPNENGDTIAVQHPLILKVFPDVKILLIENSSLPPSYSTVAVYENTVYHIPQEFNFLFIHVYESLNVTQEDIVNLFVLCCFTSFNSTIESIICKNEIHIYDDVTYNYLVDITIASQLYTVYIKYANNEIIMAYIFCKNEEVNIIIPQPINPKVSMEIIGADTVDVGGVKHYYIPVSENASAKKITVKFKFSGLDTNKTHIFKIRPTYGFGTLFVGPIKLDVQPDGKAEYVWTPPNSTYTGFCYGQMTSNGQMEVQAFPQIICLEHRLTGSFQGNKMNYVIYYNNQFFINHPEGFTHANTFAGWVKEALVTSWDEEVVNWQLALGCNDGIPYDADNLLEVIVCDTASPLNFKYHDAMVKTTSASLGEQRVIGIFSREKILPSSKNYQPEQDMIYSAICHEFYHGIQWTHNQSWNNQFPKKLLWMIEGQARFIQSVFMQNHSIGNNPPCGNEEFRIMNDFHRDSKNFLTEQLTIPYIALNYDKEQCYGYCLFWRHLYEHYKPQGTVQEKLDIIRNTCRGNIYQTVQQTNNFMDQQLLAGGGEYDSFRDSQQDFAISCYLNKPNQNRWNPCPEGFYAKPEINENHIINSSPYQFSFFLYDTYTIEYGEANFGKLIKGCSCKVTPPAPPAIPIYGVSLLFLNNDEIVSIKPYGAVIFPTTLELNFENPFNKIVIVVQRLDVVEVGAKGDELIIEFESNVHWENPVDNNWWNPDNWDNGLCPDINDNVIIPFTTENPILSNGYAKANTITIEGGNLTVAGGTLFIDDSLSNYSGLTVTNGNIKCTGTLYTKPGSTFNVNGGTVDVASWMRDATFDLAEGTINLTGGTVKVYGSVRFSTTAVVNQTGPFNMYIGGDYQVNNNTNTTDGTIHLTGQQSPGMNVVCQATNPSSGNDLYVWNLVINPVSPSTTTAFALDDPVAINNNVYVQNMLKVVNGTLSTYNGAGHASALNVNGNFWVYNNANFQTDANTAVSINGDLKLWAGSSGYSSWIDNGNVSYVKNPQLEQVYVTSSVWHMISPPISSSTAGLFAGKFIQKHDETTNLWSDITLSSEPLLPFTGYALYSNWTYSIPWKGSLNTGTYSASLTRNNTGWNALGNPYPSPVDWDDAIGWTKTNVANAVYIENNGGWATYINGIGANGGSPYIAPGQGFFVECTSAVGGLQVNNHARTHARAPFFKEAVSDLIRLQVSGNERTDETVIYFNENSSRAFDYDYDAHKMFAYLDEIPQIYSLDNGNMAINALPEADMVLLGFKAGVSGQYTIAATEINDIPHAILEDLETGVMTDLKTSSHVFNYMAGDDEARFALHFVPEPSRTVLTDVVRIYSTGREIYVNAPEGFTGEAFVYNLLGEMILQTHISNMLNKISVGNSGTYVVRVINPGVAISEKVVVSK